ncbi:MAG TPA: cyclic nucleotide-binding domain-containing protein [Acidimicrobiales bacterium]|nr:cyclic nucleotide-binding domain-containing protein [Acidimicrobiales bacterium]
MARDEKLEHLAHVRLFSALNKKELALVGRASDEVRVTGGKVLVEEGAAGHEFFLILEGQAVVRRGGRRVAMLGPGQYFGEMALLDRGPRTATVVADTDMDLLVLGQREFSGLLDQVPALCYKLLAAMAARLREADARATTH